MNQAPAEALSQVADLITALGQAPDAVAKVVSTQFSALMTIEQFYENTPSVHVSLAQVRRHVSQRHDNGLADCGAVINREGYPLLIHAPRWFEWLTRREQDDD